VNTINWTKTKIVGMSHIWCCPMQLSCVIILFALCNCLMFKLITYYRGKTK
jgi:hypothetical protein